VNYVKVEILSLSLNKTERTHSSPQPKKTERNIKKNKVQNFLFYFFIVDNIAGKNCFL